nr:hypothetical protein [Tanacetum cinerariifolium]
MSTESVGNKPDRKVAGMDEPSPMKAEEKIPAKSGVTKSDSKGVGMVEASHTTPSKRCQSNLEEPMRLEKLQAWLNLHRQSLICSWTNWSGCYWHVVVMTGRVWDVNAIIGRYLSTDLVVFDAWYSTQFPEIKGRLHLLNKKTLRFFLIKISTGFSNMITSCLSLMGKQQCESRMYQSISAKSGVTKSDSKGVGMAEASHTTPSKRCQSNLEVPMRVWDVNAITGRYLSTDLVVSYSWGQSLKVTLWGGLGDALILRKTKHVGMCAIVLTSVSPKTYNNKLYLSSTSSTIIYDNDDIPCLQELKKSESFVEQKKEGLTIDSSRPREGTLENLLIWARNRKNDCMVLFTLGPRSSLCRYRLEVIVVDDTAHTIVVMFNDTATELLNCSAESLLGAGEDEDDESSLPTAIRNLIGTHHVVEIKSHTYYEYRTFESFKC